MNRLAVFVFWEENGIVRDFIAYYLNGLKEVAQDILVVVNGKITSEGRKKIESTGSRILVRSNTGLDFWGWKAGFEYIGWDKVRQYDEVIITNCTCYGPIYPLQEMFYAMSARDCDFWGINRHPDMGMLLITDDPESAIIEHIQSYFLVFKPKLFHDPIFQLYWDDLRPIKTYHEAVGYHETKLTKFFEEHGFKSDTYMDFAESQKLVKHNPTFLLADKQLIEKRSPFVKRKFFNCEYQLLYYSFGTQCVRVMDYLEHQTNYDINMIWDDLLETQKMSDLKTHLHLTRILPSNVRVSEEDTDKKVALILYIYYIDLVDYCHKYAMSMPDSSDIYIVTIDSNVEKECRKVFAASSQKIIYRKMQNRGRDQAAYLVACADVFDHYDYICCMHDKKTPSAINPLEGEEFSEHCFINNLKSKEYVHNIIDLFDRESRLGMLCPPILNFGEFDILLGNETTWDLETMKELCHKLNLTIPIDDAVVAPFGSMFWVRAKAFKPIFNHKWIHNDLPPEPVVHGSTLLHGLERTYPLVIQQAGYYVASCATENYARIFMDNLLLNLRNINIKLYKCYGVHYFLYYVYRLDNMQNELKYLRATSSKDVGETDIDTEIHILSKQIYDNNNKIAEILNSRTWRYGQKLAKIMRFFIPKKKFHKHA